MATEYVTRSEFDALRGEFDQFVRLFESNTSAGNAVRAERKVAERKARNARLHALPPAQFVAEVEPMRPYERESVHLPPARAVELARLCDGELRVRLFALLTDGTAADVAFALFDPPSRTRVTLPAGTEMTVQTNDVMLAEVQTERAEAAGLPVEYRRTSKQLDRAAFLLGFKYAGSAGWSEVLPTESVTLWRELSPQFDALCKRGTVATVLLTDDESRAESRDEWREAGAKRAELPALPTPAASSKVEPEL